MYRKERVKWGRKETCKGEKERTCEGKGKLCVKSEKERVSLILFLTFFKVAKSYDFEINSFRK
jgi:hypothetical protein